MSHLMRQAGFIAMFILALSVAGYAVIAYGALPLGALVFPPMRASFLTHPLGVYAHIFGAAVALALGPFQWWSALRTKHLNVHRWLGRLYLGFGVFVGGVSGLFLAFHAFGGVPARLGFAGLAVSWLYTGQRAYRAIRAGNVASHRRWMVRNFSLTFAAVTLRLYLPTALASGVDGEVAYPIIAWLCWIPNLIAAQWLLDKSPHPSIERTFNGRVRRLLSGAHVKR